MATVTSPLCCGRQASVISEPDWLTMQNLLPKIATGDPAAVEDFLKRHTGMVWGLARRFCRNAEDAEDATQEIFVDVWRSAARYDANAGSEVTFLMTIARRRLIDRARRLGRRISADLLEDPTTIPSPAAPDAVELQDEVARAQDALGRLRPEQREVLDLALGQGQTHQEIAASIGIPLGTVKSHARRGLIKLREMLGSDTEEDGVPSGGPGGSEAPTTRGDIDHKSNGGPQQDPQRGNP